MISVLVLTVSQIQGGSRCPVLPPDHDFITPGWHDEMSTPKYWSPLGIENQAKVIETGGGVMTLQLPHVPAGWPYSYQWSGVTRDMRVDIAKYPVLMARVPWIQGYAHMDIEVLDFRGKAIKGFRSTTLTSPGIAEIDLSKSLDPATYVLRLRLIVGGPNEGCSAAYDWVRYLKPDDAVYLRLHPDFSDVSGAHQNRGGGGSLGFLGSGRG